VRGENCALFGSSREWERTAATQSRCIPLHLGGICSILRLQMEQSETNRLDGRGQSIRANCALQIRKGTSRLRWEKTAISFGFLGGGDENSARMNSIIPLIWAEFGEFCDDIGNREKPWDWMAERGGFEPPTPFWGVTA
jgi:hypothetical protein